MATLTIRNVPADVYDALTERAKRRHRSLNSEVLIQLETALGHREIDVETELEEIRQFRDRLKGLYVTEDIVQLEKERGRP